MLFKNPLFKFVAELIDGSPVPVAIAGGAVRDEVNGRKIKDFDILVHEDHLDSFHNYLLEQGADLLITREDVEDGSAYGELPDSFNSRYVDWLKYECLINEYFYIDVLVLGHSKYPKEQHSHNFVNAVHAFDNTMNMWLYHAGTISFLGGQGYLTANAKQAIQLREVSVSRELHIIDIAAEIGWTYVPLQK